MNPVFWRTLDKLVASNTVTIDCPKGSAHSQFPEYISPLDYGCLEGTTSGDGQAIDVWLGRTDP